MFHIVSLITFVELFKCIVISLEEISRKSLKSSSTAARLLAAVEKSEFLVSLIVCEKPFSQACPLSIFLEEKILDLSSALNQAKNVIETLKKLTKNASTSFHELFSFANQLYSVVFQSQFTSRQRHKPNPNPVTTSGDMEGYYRVTVFIPCVEALINKVTERFIINEDILTSFQVLLPGVASPDKVDLIKDLSRNFAGTTCLSTVKAEYILWCNMVANIQSGTEVLKLLQLCDKTYYRTIHFLLTVLATLPVTTCSVERTFSTMKRVKTLPYSVMGNERLSALAMLSSHWDITVEPDKVTKMAGKKKRRLLL